MAKRKRKHVSRPSAAEYATNVQRRMIEVLIAVAPDAPVLRPLLEAIISTDSLIAGPSLRVADNLALAPSVVSTTVEHAEDLRQLTTDVARGTCMVTVACQERLRALFATLPQSSQVKQHHLDDLTDVQDALLAEMYDAASYVAGTQSDDYGPDQIALLVPHLLHIIDTKIKEPDGRWMPAHALTILWPYMIMELCLKGWLMSTPTR